MTRTRHGCLSATPVASARRSGRIGLRASPVSHTSSDSACTKREEHTPSARRTQRRAIPKHPLYSPDVSLTTPFPKRYVQRQSHCIVASPVATPAGDRHGPCPLQRPRVAAGVRRYSATTPTRIAPDPADSHAIGPRVTAVSLSRHRACFAPEPRTLARRRTPVPQRHCRCGDGRAGRRRCVVTASGNASAAGARRTIEQGWCVRRVDFA